MYNFAYKDIKIKKFIVVLMIVFNTFISTAQNNNKNAVYLEFLGNALFYSVNYERHVKISDFLKWRNRVGFALDLSEKNEYTKDRYYFLYIPLETSIFFGKKNHFVHLNFGYTNNYRTYKKGSIVISSTGSIVSDARENFTIDYNYFIVKCGYRYQLNSGLFADFGLLHLLKESKTALDTPDRMKGYSFPKNLFSIGLGYKFLN